MITDSILQFFIGIIEWIVGILPTFDFTLPEIASLEFLTTLRLYLNYFLTPVTASILINILLFAPMSLIVWGIIKLIRYFLPL